MTEAQWNFFSNFKNEFKNFCEVKNSFNNDFVLTKLQQKIATENSVPPYPIETNVVYNNDLEKFTNKSDVKIILVADNPGKNEQLSTNRRYLIGQAGKLAENFFARHSELEINFRENVLILNKSPLHTAKTILLKKLLKSFHETTGKDALQNFFLESQRFMATAAFNLQENFNAKLFIVGYSELGPKKIFAQYWETLKSLYEKKSHDNLFCFQHFSMNRFTVDLKQNYKTALSLSENLKRLGAEHRKNIFGF